MSRESPWQAYERIALRSKATYNVKVLPGLVPDMAPEASTV